MTHGGRDFEPGTAWIVPTRQPKYRMVRSIFERTSEYADSSFYDASTWTMSLAYGMPDAEVRSAGFARGPRVAAVPAPAGLGAVPRERLRLPARLERLCAPRALTHLLSNGVQAEVAFQPFTHATNEGNRDYPSRLHLHSGAVAAGSHTARLHELVLEAERGAGVPFQSTSTGRADAGVDLGSGNLRPITAPRVLLLVGEGIVAGEAGQVWHLLDTKVGLPITKADRRDLDRVDLNRYDVIVLVSGNYSFLTGDRLEDLRRWVRAGGTLVAQRTAARWATTNGFTPNARIREQSRQLRPRPPRLRRRLRHPWGTGDRRLHLESRRGCHSPARLRLPQP